MMRTSLAGHVYILDEFLLFLGMFSKLSKSMQFRFLARLNFPFSRSWYIDRKRKEVTFGYSCSRFSHINPIQAFQCYSKVNCLSLTFLFLQLQKKSRCSSWKKSFENSTKTITTLINFSKLFHEQSVYL